MQNKYLFIGLILGLAFLYGSPEEELVGSSGGAFAVPVTQTEIEPETSPMPLVSDESFEGAVDPDSYIMGPNDIVSITFWGENFKSIQLPVLGDGVLLVPTLGPIKAAGGTMTDLKSAVVTAAEEKYKNVTIDVNLFRARTFKVHILGAVHRPGVYTFSSTDRLAATIEKSYGLVRTGASYRNISFKTDAGDAKIDLLSYLRLGDLTHNPYLLDGCVVNIPTATDTVWISGEVALPGDYEFRPGEAVGHLIAIAGGVTGKADPDNVTISRLRNGSLERITVPVNPSDFTGASELLEAGDQVLVGRWRGYKELGSVTVEGEAVTPGRYPIEFGKTTLKQVLDMCGGLTERAFIRGAMVVRNDSAAMDKQVIRQIDSLRLEKNEFDQELIRASIYGRTSVVPVDFAAVLNGNGGEHNIILQNRDIIRIPQIPQTVAIKGRLKNPGHYRFIAGEDAGYYIRKAGSYAKRAHSSKTFILRPQNGAWLAKSDVDDIMPGDVIVVPEKPEKYLWTLVKDVLTFTYQAATVYIAIFNVINLGN